MAQYAFPIKHSTIFNADDFSTQRRESPSIDWGTAGQTTSLQITNGSSTIASITGGVNSLADGAWILSASFTDHNTPTTSFSASCLIESSSSSVSGGLTIQTNSSSVSGNVFGSGLPAGSTLPSSSVGIVFAGPWTSVSVASSYSQPFDVKWTLTQLS